MLITMLRPASFSSLVVLLLHVCTTIACLKTIACWAPTGDPIFPEERLFISEITFDGKIVCGAALETGQGVISPKEAGGTGAPLAIVPLSSPNSEEKNWSEITCVEGWQAYFSLETRNKEGLHGLFNLKETSADIRVTKNWGGVAGNAQIDAQMVIKRIDKPNRIIEGINMSCESGARWLAAEGNRECTLAELQEQGFVDTYAKFAAEKFRSEILVQTELTPAVNEVVASLSRNGVVASVI